MTGEAWGRGRFAWAAAGCGELVRSVSGSPTLCEQPPVWVGLRHRDKPRPITGKGFACEITAPSSIVARRMTDADWVELQRRSDGERPAPLAVGQAALDLITAARQWAARQDQRQRSTRPGRPGASAADRQH